MVDGVVGHFFAMVCLMGLGGGLLDGSWWCFSTVEFLSSGGLLGCLFGVDGVVGCACGLRPLVVGLWWLGW